MVSGVRYILIRRSLVPPRPFYYGQRHDQSFRGRLQLRSAEKSRLIDCLTLPRCEEMNQNGIPHIYMKEDEDR